MDYHRFRLVDLTRPPIKVNAYAEPTVIGFSGRMYSGKTTAANMLLGDLVSRFEERAVAAGQLNPDSTNYPVAREPFADTLKLMLLAVGLSYDDLYGDKKDTPNDLLCGKTPRHAMQTLGTEWRNMIDRNLWANLWENRYKTLREIDKGYIVLVDDVRFEHEIKVLRSLGGVLIKIERLDTDQDYDHASEQKLPDTFFDAVVQNNNDITHLYVNVNEAIEAVKERHGVEQNV